MRTSQVQGPGFGVRSSSPVLRTQDYTLYLFNSSSMNAKALLSLDWLRALTASLRTTGLVLVRAS